MQRSLFEVDHDDFRASVREFVARHIEPNEDKFIEQRYIDREVWLEAGRNGYLGLEVPEEYGGSAAGDYRFNTVLCEELSRSSAAAASAFTIHYDCAAPYLVTLTTEEQKRRWLPKFCSGEMITAIGMTEPSGGSDLAALKTTAVKDGSSYVINGSKTFITNGTQADMVIVASRTTPEKGSKGITLFAVETGMPGFTRGRKLDKVGQPEADTAELFFEDVRVDESAIIGEVDRGFIHMMTLLPQERISVAVANLAHARRILEDTVEYAKERKAFGQAIGSLQWNKFLLAEMVTKLDVTQAYVDNCVAAHLSGELTAIDAAKAKYWSSVVQNEILDNCVQIHGGYGFMNEYRVARAWKDARVTKIWAGSNEIMREVIGRDLGL
ncbi:MULTISPECIES: acyl-CoA dehydrogenase family protein [Mycolicibacterium]|uniref:Acyl-CoA dehydrogenase n=1 Tax=Mycolicibacterium mucogenicum TaxID=56689 RepID=A0A4R5WNQ0_MYCMU|nr:MULTISPECIES: acyl-CoA dehydrogenase family protein [Mycolicibacterium]TDK93021.1 acyl-CoA dehydrogenase [Mycolicibacterium mucogenicum]BCI83403.1 putative acyl-CoA dehydrogenase (FadE) [Mycolicibacterium sp. TY66]BCJ78953.1 putative acyl-CoA dehydrogenase (FadE) [Mycolicibacterium sp. TY81]